MADVLDLGAFAEERVGFIKEEDGAALFGGIKDLFEVFFGLADVFADHARQIDAI